MERIHHMKECFIDVVESQLGRLEEVDAKELGEVVDIIKDFEEIIYYNTITKAMNEKDSHYSYWIEEEKKEPWHNSEPEGASSFYRKKYLMSKDMKDLEHYAKELTEDIVKMIEGASAEEKQFMQRKLTSLINKISQMEM